jgi:hypothetical protein
MGWVCKNWEGPRQKFDFSKKSDFFAPEFRSQKPEVRSQKPEARSQKPEARSQKSEVKILRRYHPYHFVERSVLVNFALCQQDRSRHRSIQL